MRETYDASINGRKGLLYVGYGAAGEGGDTATAAGDATALEGTMIRFVRGDDGEVPLSFDASRLLSCDAKGRYRMVVVHEECTGGGDDEEPGEKRLTVVRVRGTAVDRVIGAVLDLAERAAKGDGQGGRGGDGGGGSDGSDAAVGIGAGSATTAIAAAPAGTGGFGGTVGADVDPTVVDAAAAPPQPARKGRTDGKGGESAVQKP